MEQLDTRSIEERLKKLEFFIQLKDDRLQWLETTLSEIKESLSSRAFELECALLSYKHEYDKLIKEIEIQDKKYDMKIRKLRAQIQLLVRMHQQEHQES